jgi:hypothetical protein
LKKGVVGGIFGCRAFSLSSLIRRATVNADCYCRNWHSKEVIWREYHGLRIGKATLLFDSTQFHPASVTVQLLEIFWWEYLIHSQCSVNVAPCNFQLIEQLKKHFKHFKEHF